MTIAPQDEVVRLCQDLIRFDTSNYGEGRGAEADAAAYVVASLREVGLQPTVYESAPQRHTVVVRIPGADPTRGGLCVHGHLDVVPADASEWQVDPFSGQIRDGCIWGRGAVDMKGMDAMMLAVVRHLARTGQVPPRDLLIVFFADEEAAGSYGSKWLVENHPEVFDGISEAISEVGGYSVTLPRPLGDPQRVYLLQTAEKGIAWLRITAHGPAGHGSLPASETAITRLASAVTRIAEHTWPTHLIPSVEALLQGAGRLMQAPTGPDAASPVLAGLGGAGAFVRASMQNTANVTTLTAGYKHNVIPGSASALVDCRFLPGHEEELMDTLGQLVGPDIDVEVLVSDVALQAPVEGALVDAMTAALTQEDPSAHVLPYCLSGGTDNKALSRLGITGYGFAPLQLPADLDFAGMFHGVDERVPVESLHFGTRVLLRFLRAC
ncbi:MAG: M20/M25/M40 family metallo-hydrolase [Nostocoides sp.]